MNNKLNESIEENFSQMTISAVVKKKSRNFDADVGVTGLSVNDNSVISY